MCHSPECSLKAAFADLVLMDVSLPRSYDPLEALLLILLNEIHTGHRQVSSSYLLRDLILVFSKCILNLGPVELAEDELGLLPSPDHRVVVLAPSRESISQESLCKLFH